LIVNVLVYLFATLNATGLGVDDNIPKERNVFDILPLQNPTGSSTDFKDIFFTFLKA
jgi:hypothetical protein